MVRMEAQLTFFRDKREALLNGVKLKSHEKGFLSHCQSIILTSTERYEYIFWPISQETFRFESVGIFPITSYITHSKKRLKICSNIYFPKKSLGFLTTVLMKPRRINYESCSFWN